MLRFITRRRRRRPKEEEEKVEVHEEEEVSLLPSPRTDDDDRRTSTVHRQQEDSHKVTWGEPSIHLVDSTSTTTTASSAHNKKPNDPPSLQQQQQKQQQHPAHDSDIYSLVQKLATKLQDAEKRNKKLRNNLSVVRVVQQQLDDARRLLRAVLWPYHGDYNSKDYMKAIQHVSELRVQLKRHDQWMMMTQQYSEEFRSEKGKESPDEMIALLQAHPEQDDDDDDDNDDDITTKTALAGNPTMSIGATTPQQQTQHVQIVVNLRAEHKSLQEQVTELKDMIEQLELERAHHVNEIGALLERSMQLQNELETNQRQQQQQHGQITPAETQDVLATDLQLGDLDKLMEQFKRESESLFRDREE